MCTCTCTLSVEMVPIPSKGSRLLFMGDKLIPSVSILTDNFWLHFGEGGGDDGRSMGGWIVPCT